MLHAVNVIYFLIINNDLKKANLVEKFSINLKIYNLSHYAYDYDYVFANNLYPDVIAQTMDAEVPK